MLKIGYVRLRGEAVQEDIAALRSVGCQVVRVEEPAKDGQVLSSILDFIGAGDELVVTRLERLASSGRGLLTVIERLEARGASLSVLHPQLSSQGSSGRALRAVLGAVTELEPDTDRRRRRTAAAHEIFALQREGVGPVEIARRLGVSRMTVWRKLKAVETAQL